eukprot:5759009-Heterocapsa_arctica.AAC.1
MSGEAPWYLDFAKWRIRRSIVGAVKLLMYDQPFRLDGPKVFWEIREFAGGLQFAGKGWALHRWFRKGGELTGIVDDLRRAGLNDQDV